HNTPNNSDHDDDIHNSVTRISKLDISDPLHLHPNDTIALTIVSIKLKGTKNYQVWSCDMLLALECKNKIGFIDGSCKRSKDDEVLDDSYMQIRSSILSREVFPDVRSAYAIISSEESHKVVVGSIAGSSQRNQASAFVSDVPNSQNFQKSNQNFSTGPSRLNNLDNNRQGGGSGLVCENCGFNGHTIDRCFKIIGYPVDFGKKKSDEQIATLISLIKDNKVRNVQANMAVGHPNGTEAYIFKIENLKLYNGVTLYDVMVIPKYYVTLISVHKLVKENKWEGLYYYNDQGHPADHVLNVLKDSLPIDKKDNIVYCEIFQRAKQTREHFSLSDHTSKRLGDLVHLDLRAPYMVTSSEGFRYFLTVVDDYTRAVWVYLIESKDESDSSSSSMFGSNINTVDFPVDNSGNYADISDEFVATQNEEVATLEENIFFDGNLDQNPSSSHGVQNVRRSSRQSVFLRNYNDFVVESKVKYELEKYVGYSKLNSENLCFVTQLNKTKKPKTYFKAYKYPHSTNAMNQEMDTLLKNGTWEIVELPEGRKAIGNGIDYEETFSHVVKMVTVRCLLNVAMCMSWHVFQITVNTAFLYCDLEEVVYMKPPEGYFPSDNKIEKFKKFLKSKFMIKDFGKLKYFLGIEVVDTNKASDKDHSLENITDYQKLMGKLIYLTNTRPDISYDVHCLSQFMHSLLTSHLKIAFKILRYLKSCPGLGVHSTKTSDYRALASVTSEVIWILKFLKDLQVENLLHVSLHYDSNSAIKIAANQVFHERTKHLEIDLHFVREKILNGVVKTVKVDSANQITDILTKGLYTIQHYELIKKLGMYDVYQVETKG
ncbi:ribonuclease H-like domain-containing protein, partial [Tanacetum coccineum]